MAMYNCKKTTLIPPKDFIPNNCAPGYKDSIQVDICLADEIENLWSHGVITRGCCCGHGVYLGTIVVDETSIDKMIELGYVNFVYTEDYWPDRKDTFISKSYGHIYDGYSNGFQY